MNSKRMYYHDYDFYPCMLLIDQHVKSMLKENIAPVIRNTQYQFPHIGETTMRKRLGKKWTT